LEFADVDHSKRLLESLFRGQFTRGQDGRSL
jgi:hypothetical protein